MNIEQTQWEPINDDLNLAADFYVNPTQPQFSICVLWNDTFWKPCFILYFYKIRIQVGWLVG